jgi:PAS domain S-box-containing protein
MGNFGLKDADERLSNVKKVKQAMTELFHGFQALVEDSPDAISVIDAGGAIVYSSASNKTLFGYQPDELVGRNCLELVHPEDREHSKRALTRALTAPPQPLQWDARVRQKNGNYCWVENTVSTILLELEVKALVVRQRDIQARRLMEKERQQHAEELTQSNLRLEEFAYTAAHDLREPLRAISLYTEILLRTVHMDANAQQLAKFVVDGTVQMFALLDDLLCFAQTGMHEPPRRLHLQKALEQALRILAPAIQASGAMVRIGELPVVKSDEIQVVRLFQNLISNALKYRRSEALVIDVSAERRGGDWVIRVSDNGLGIAEADRERVFLPFIRLAKSEAPGSGLGLAVCKRIVEGLGGTICVEPQTGHGSTFAFTLAAGLVAGKTRPQNATEITAT